MQEKIKISLEMHEKLFFKELDEPLRNFSQCKDSPDDNEISIAVLDSGKSAIIGKKRNFIRNKTYNRKGWNKREK